MSRQERLGLDDPSRPVPTRPTWLHAIGGQCLAEPFDDLAGLAARVAQLAGGRGLRLAPEPTTTAAAGFEPFKAWSVYALDDASAEEWLGQAAIQTIPRERLEAALRAAGERRAA